MTPSKPRSGRAAPRGADQTRAVAKAALASFSEGGYRLTQIAHVSERLGVSVGAIYRHVESKEALFHLAVLAAVNQLPEAFILPMKVSGFEDTLRVMGELVDSRPAWPILRKALRSAAPPDRKAEARAVGGELFAIMSGRAALIRLLDRCAQDIPELAEVFDRQVRNRLLDDLITWVHRRRLAGDSQKPAAEALARGAMEAVAWLAKARPYDSTATAITEDQARDAAVRIFANAFD